MQAKIRTQGLEVMHRAMGTTVGRNGHINILICIKLSEKNCNDQQGFSHTGQCKRTGGCYNELVVAFYSTGGGVKGKKKNLYLLTLLFIYKLAFVLFVMTPGAQTTGNISVYGSVKQLVI